MPYVSNIQPTDYDDWTDTDIRDVLKEIDDDDSVNEQLSEWETAFINSVAFGDFELSAKQRASATKIIQRYGK